MDCSKPSGYFVSAERAAPELLDMDVTAGPVCCIAPEPKVGSTVLICYEHMVVLWDWGKTRRLNAWSVPKHESIGDVVDVAWNDCGSHFAIGLSSGVYSVVCVSMAESERVNGRLVLHPRLIDVDNVPVDLSSISGKTRSTGVELCCPRCSLGIFLTFESATTVRTQHMYLQTCCLLYTCL